MRETACASVRSLFAKFSVVTRRGVHGEVRPVDEFRSTACHSACGCVLLRVRVPAWLSHREQRAAAKRAAAVARGESVKPAPAGAWRTTHGLLYCDSPWCSAPHARLVLRDGDAATSLLDRAYAGAAGEPVPWYLQRGLFPKLRRSDEFFYLVPATASG